MKNYIIILLLLAIVPLTYAQRMLPGQRGIELTAGALSAEYPGRNYYLQLAMTVNAKKGNHQLWAFEYSRTTFPYKDIRIPRETYTAEAGYSFYLFGDSRKNITMNTALTAVAGYESINQATDLLYDGARIIDEDNFIYGAGIRLSMDTYLSDQWVLLLQARTKVVWGSDLKQFRPSAGIGLRFNF